MSDNIHCIHEGFCTCPSKKETVVDLTQVEQEIASWPEWKKIATSLRQPIDYDDIV